MLWLKQSTAVILKMGPFVDSTDGVTAKTGLTIAQGDILISKNGGAFAQTSAASPTTTHDADGWYPIPLTTTDTATLGTIKVQVTMAGALPVWQECMVLPAVVYDALVLGTDYLEVDAMAVSGSTDAADDMEIIFDTDFSTNYDTTLNCFICDVQYFNGNNAPSMPANFQTLAIEAVTGRVQVQVGTGDGKLSTSNGAVILQPSEKTWSTHSAADVVTALGTGAGLTSLASAANMALVLADTNELQTDWANGGRLDLLLDAAGAGGDATEANQTTIITHLEDLKGTGFVKDTNSLVNVTAGEAVNVTTETTIIESE